MDYHGQNRSYCGCSRPVHPFVSVAEKLFYLNSLSSSRPTVEPDRVQRPQYSSGRRCSCPETACSPFVSKSSVWEWAAPRSTGLQPQRRPNRDALAIIENLARRRRSCASMNPLSSLASGAKRFWRGNLGRKNQIGSSAISRKVY